MKTTELAKLIIENGLEGCDKRFIYIHFQHDSMIKGMIAYYAHLKGIEIDKDIISELITEIKKLLLKLL
jgi:hypothetical protein